MSNRVISFRLTDDEFRTISVHSARSGQSISASVRALVLSSIEDRSSAEILNKVDAIQAEMSRTKTPEAVQDLNSLAIRRALASLVENHFLPMAAVDRKPQIRDILAALKASN
jgi:hypothetical protein